MASYVDPAILTKIGNRVISLIIQRTTEGKDINGKPFRGYSTRPFALPAGATTKRALAILVKDGRASYFTTRAGSLWVVIKDGYKALKEAEFAKAGGAGGVTLQRTGRMLRAMTVTSVNASPPGIVLGFTRTEDAQKAFWNQQRGRVFFGITAEEFGNDSEIAKLLVEGLRVRTD